MGSNKRKIIYYFIGILCLLLIPSINVYAFSVPELGIKIDSKNLTTTNKVYTDIKNVTLSIKQVSDTLINDVTDIPTYGYISLCQAIPSDIVEWYDVGSSQDYLSDINIHNTQRSCKVYGSDIYPNARIIYITFRVFEAFNCNVNGTSCYLNDVDIVFYSSHTEEWSLSSYGFSDEPIQYDSSSDKLITQNNSLISQNGTIINQNEYIKNQNDLIIYEQGQTNQKLDKVDETLNNSDSSGATDSAGSFFSGFTTDTFGLTSIITAPLNLIQSITSSTCSSMGIPVPFVDTTMNLPCLSSIYKSYFGSFLDIYQTITFGIVAYWVCVRIFALVKDFKNPEHDEIEVFDL